MIEDFIRAIHDIFKYKITAFIVTGDRTMDALIVALILMFTNIFVDATKRKDLFSYFTGMVYNRNNCRPYPNFPEVEKSFQVNISYSDYRYVGVIMHAFNLSVFDSDKKCTKWQDVIQSIDANSYGTTLMYYYRGSYVTYTKKDEGIIVSTKNRKIFDAYFKDVENAFVTPVDAPKKESPNCGSKHKIIYYPALASKVHYIEENRTFRFYVSRYKQKLLTNLENFIKINKSSESCFNGYGTYNLGLILYGTAGCGKTSLIKAMANYLNRDVVIVNMRKIKTKSAFENMFDSNKIDKHIFVFEEFDCLPIHSRETNEEKKEDAKEKLYTQRLEFASILAKTTEENMRKSVQQELDKLDKTIADLDDTLTIDAILTILDGVNEHRNRVIIATTNHIEKIDPALLREGRFDHRLHMQPFNNSEIRELLNNMFKVNAKEEEGIEEVDYSERLSRITFPEGKWTPVYIIHTCHVNSNLDEAIKALEGKEDVHPLGATKELQLQSETELSEMEKRKNHRKRR